MFLEDRWYMIQGVDGISYQDIKSDWMKTHTYTHQRKRQKINQEMKGSHQNEGMALLQPCLSWIWEGSLTPGCCFCLHEGCALAYCNIWKAKQDLIMVLLSISPFTGPQLPNKSRDWYPGKWNHGGETGKKSMDRAGSVSYKHIRAN